MSATLRRLHAQANRVGATVEVREMGDVTEYHADAGERVFASTGTHTLLCVVEPGGHFATHRAAIASLMEDVSGGLMDCEEGDCTVCYEIRTVDQ